MKNILYYSLILTVVFSCSQKNNSKSQTSEQIEFNESSVKAYLMVYFKDEDHSLHMSLSNDGYSFSDINQGKAVFAWESIDEQKGGSTYLQRS